jgi:hypothetical protein
MNSRWVNLVSISLVIFASLVITWQFRHCDGDLKNLVHSSLVPSFIRGERLAGITNIVPRNHEPVPFSEKALYYDLVLPKNVSVFITDMTGPTNYNRIMYYYYMTYYLFPREVGTSLDHKTCITKDRLLGRTSESSQEILTNGFDVRFDISPVKMDVTALSGISVRFPTNPVWFNSNYDTSIAFLLPLLTALAGMWLFRFLFSTLSGQMPLLEQLACGLGLGMMAVTAFTLGIKLCGWHGYHLAFLMTGMGTIAEIWRNHKVYGNRIADGCGKMVHRPVILSLFVAGSLVFLVLFRLAGLQGLVEYDAVMAWSLKAKIIHLCTGGEIVQWFSNPRLAHAHLDYPTLVPSLHAATYDSIGHVDEFITKFWPTWMLFFLLAGLASLNRGAKGLFHAPYFALLGLLLLPATQKYVQMEGGTLPMIFFTVMGFVQCALWLVEKDRSRLGLGLTLLFGAAMAKFEGFIFLALAGSWLLLVPSARPSLRPSPNLWRMLAFWFLAALPFICLRIRIPVLHFESGWAGYALHNPGLTLSNCPWIFIILLARLFVNSDFADWNGENGEMHWTGRWDNFSSMYNHATLGLAWLCLFMTVACWFAVPARRQVVVWVLAMLVGALAAFSMVFASLFNVTNLVATIGYTEDHIAGRYLLPILLAWFATIMTLFFANWKSDVSTLAPENIVTNSSAYANTPDWTRPMSKGGFWLACVALVIMVLGVFVLPKNKPALPEHLLPNDAVINPLDSSETNVLEEAGVRARMAAAMQMDKAGRCAEALQAYREAARLYPTNPFVLNKLAWSLAMNPVKELRDGREAIQLAGQAVELTGHQQPMLLITLAAAYAENGQFTKTFEIARNALDLTVLKGQPKASEAISRFLESFSAGKTFGMTNGP